MTSRIATRSVAVAAASLAVIAPLVGCGSSTPTSSTSSLQASSGSPTSGAGSSAAAYADGTYTVRGVYGGAPSYMTITITLAESAISKVSVEPMPDNNDISRGYQERFAAAVPDEVVGKRIDDLSVGKLAGASGCAGGFNDALTKIREQASTTR